MSAASVGIDVGGTFTDLVAVDAAGDITTLKVASTPGDQSEAVSVALARATEGGRAVSRFVHGTTVATNMLLERKGARVALVTTDGFTDLLHLARQDRASLYDLTRHQPAPLVPRERTVGARERVTPEGVTVPLDDDAVADVVGRVRSLDADVVAIALLHSYANPDHERRLGQALRDALPDLDVILSSDVFPEIREYERASTAVAEGYLRPGVARYLQRLTTRAAEHGVPAPGVMTSGGGMRSVADASRHAASLALSGPAGGVVGASAALRAAGFSDALTVDIGGTSADVGLIIGSEPLVESGGRIAGVAIALPRVLVETVSAGGGSIGWVDDGGALRVGPHSAGALPGPAAFGRGGTLPTVTDAHVVLGHITADALSGGVSLDPAAAHAALRMLAKQLDAPLERVARAMLDIADAAVARALRRVSVERGIDPRGCVLVPFGGGGPLHCCGLADQLGMTRIFVPPHAGVLSALGLAITAERRERLISVLRLTSALDSTAIDRLLDEAADGVRWHRADLLAAGEPSRVAREARADALLHLAEDWQRSWSARARYVGQGYELDVAVLRGEDGDDVAKRFAVLHRERNGFTLEAPVELVGLRHVASGPAHPVRFSPATVPAYGDVRPVGGDEPSRVRLVAGDVVALPGATLRVTDGWRGAPHPAGGWLLERESP